MQPKRRLETYLIFSQSALKKLPSLAKIRDGQTIQNSKFFHGSTQMNYRTLLGEKGIATRSKDSTRSSWHRYYEQGR